MVLLVDEFAALLTLVDRTPSGLANETVALTYSRAYRLTRALLNPGPGRLRVRGRFTHVWPRNSPRRSARSSTLDSLTRLPRPRTS